MGNHQNLDPRGEQCIDCHGKSADMSPNGKLAHNIGLQKNTDHSAYADLKIIGVKVNETSGEVTVTLNQALPANAGNLSMTFAKLAPRVIHNRGHDWQNYFNSNATGRGGNEPKASFMPNGGVQPVTVLSLQVNGKTITFNLGTGREFGTLADFTVKSAYEGDDLSWNYSGIKGTKIKMGDDLATHVYCDEAHANSNQTEDVAGAKSVCWWPDGTHLTAGTFVTTDNEFVVEYNPDQTHRVTIILGSSAGNPGFNTWYDFVPSVANGAKTPSDFTSTDTTLTGSDYISPITGQVISDNYTVAEGRKAPGGIASDNDTEGHQSLPAARDVVDVQSCNSCHDGLTMHGGSGRSQTQTCVTCHNPGNLQASSGRSVDFKQLIHRLHRGANLPSEEPSIAALMNDKSLVVDTASDFTKVRFPQGPTPGEAAGITNCVKCHMGEQTKNMVQGLADELGATNFDVASKMKLAKVTPQGDNWLSVRSVNACQACHDSNIWFSGGGNFNAYNEIRNDAAGTNNPSYKNPNDLVHHLDKYMAFYSSKYSKVGFDWIGKKLTRTNEQGWVHNTAVAGDNGRFTCGSGGGCHGNNAIDTLNPMNVGDRNTNAIQQVHLELTRNYILAERFSIDISNPNVAKNAGGKYEFTADIQILDKNTNTPVTVNSAGVGPFGETFEIVSPDTAFDNYKAIGPQLGPRNLFTGYLGWMNNSPDYNHSAGTNKTDDDFVEIPGGAVNAYIKWADGETTGKVSVKLEELPNNQWATLKDNLSDVVGTLAVRGSLGTFPATLNLKAATIDFRFDNAPLNSDEGRRQVVDFLAGQGNDANRDRYAGWDKEHGSNTQSCSSCHLQLSMHAGVTNNAQACVVCHNPQRTDLNSRTKRGADLDANGLVKLGVDGQYEESLDLKRLIHGIHSAGKKFRKDPFTMYGLVVDTLPGTKGNSFPGVLSNCQSCHIETEP